MMQFQVTLDDLLGRIGLSKEQWVKTRFFDREKLASRVGVASVEKCLQELERPYLFKFMLLRPFSTVAMEFDTRPWSLRFQRFQEGLEEVSVHPSPLEREAVRKFLSTSSFPATVASSLPKLETVWVDRNRVTRDLCTLAVPLENSVTSQRFAEAAHHAGRVVDPELRMFNSDAVWPSKELLGTLRAYS